MFCSQCGSPIKDGDKFCGECGARVEAAPAAAPVPVPEEAPVIEEVPDVSETDDTAADYTIKMPDITPEMLGEESAVDTSVIQPDYTAAEADTVTEPIDPAPEAAPQPTPVVSERPPIAGPVPEGVTIIDDGSKKPKKKSKAGLIILVLLVVIAAIAIIVPTSIKKSKQNKYAQAMNCLNNGEEEQAQALFESLGDFEDSAYWAEQARCAITYKDAMALMEAEDYEEARDLFATILDYEDAEELALECESWCCYEEALQLVDEGRYLEAADVAMMVDFSIIPDAEELYETCVKQADYDIAQEYLDEGKKVEAYEIFKDLDFKDSEEKAASCTTPDPKSGETYRNDSYKGNAVDLTVKAPSDGSRTYVKIYTADNTLVSCLFIGKDGSAKITLPAGTYVIKSGYSFGPWFGPDDMFGDDGIYQVLTFDGDNTQIKLENNYEYTLTLRTDSSTSGDTVGSKGESRDDF